MANNDVKSWLLCWFALRALVAMPIGILGGWLRKLSLWVAGYELIVISGIVRHPLRGYAVKTSGLGLGADTSQWHDTIEGAEASLRFNTNCSVDLYRDTRMRREGDHETSHDSGA